MHVKEVMTASPTCCLAETSLQEVAKMMVDNDCGEIPVIDSNETKKPLGVVTDRDIVCRTVAQGRNPLDLTASDCMSTPRDRQRRHVGRRVQQAHGAETDSSRAGG